MPAACSARIRPRQTRKSPKGLEPPPRPCQRTTSRKTPGKPRDADLRTDRQTGRAPWQPITPTLIGLTAEARLKEENLSNPALRSTRFTAPILLTLGALNAWSATETRNTVSSPRRCVYASARPDCSARTWCRGATDVIERSSRTSRCTPKSQLDTSPAPLAPPSAWWPVASADSPKTGFRCWSRMERPLLSSPIDWLPEADHTSVRSASFVLGDT